MLFLFSAVAALTAAGQKALAAIGHVIDDAADPHAAERATITATASDLAGAETALVELRRKQAAAERGELSVNVVELNDAIQRADSRVQRIKADLQRRRDLAPPALRREYASEKQSLMKAEAKLAKTKNELAEFPQRISAAKRDADKLRQALTEIPKHKTETLYEAANAAGEAAEHVTELEREQERAESAVAAATRERDKAQAKVDAANDAMLAA